MPGNEQEIAHEENSARDVDQHPLVNAIGLTAPVPAMDNGHGEHESREA
jgi:hypothetical protein